MENSFSSIISQANSVMILLPKNPYFDQVAAALSLYLSIKPSKEVSVVSPSPMTVEFNNLVGVNKVESGTKNKNMVIKFVNYDGLQIDKASANLENGQFYLTVLTKPGATAPEKENLDISFSGLSADMVILIGGVNENNFPTLTEKDFSEVKMIHIGNKPLKLNAEKKVVSFTKEASSTSEVVAAILLTEGKDLSQENQMNSQSESALVIDPDVATNLIMGIEESSNRFSAPSVSAETFQIMAELMYSGGTRKVKTISPHQFPPGAIPQQDLNKQLHKPVVSSPQTISQDMQQSAPTDWLKPKVFTGTTIN